MTLPLLKLDQPLLVQHHPHGITGGEPPRKDRFGKPVHGVQPGRKGFIDKEADKESGYGNFGVRQYDYDLGKFVSTDPLWEEYREWTPYQYSVNSPPNGIDPNGDSVIILIDHEGASDLGHIAMLIGNNKDGWKLYSKNGTTWKLSGPSNINPQYGQDVYKNLADFLDDDDPDQQRYDEAYLMDATSKQDAKMRRVAEREVKEDYDVVENSCLHVVVEALNAGGFDTGGYYPGCNIPDLRCETIKELNVGKDLKIFFEISR